VNDPLARQLDDGLAQLHAPLAPEARRQLLDFLRLLARWNDTYNLTAVRDPAQMVTRHLLDSLAILPHLRGPRVLDIGTGPGLPGIPLAIARPELSFTLLDAIAKKTQFVTQAIGELRLKNVDVVQTRVENYRPAQKFDTLVSRAFASMADMLVAARHLCGPHGRFLAMKGTYPEEEMAAIPAEFVVQEVVALKVPGLEAARHLVILVPRS
jgi:16S rRNA (guanine527-N7)-methyltransferase